MFTNRTILTVRISLLLDGMFLLLLFSLFSSFGPLQMYGFSSISWAPPKVSFSGGTPFSQCGREIVADVIRHHSRVGIPCLELLLDFLSSVQL
ncbi:Histidinol dehydrogenase [Dirofilaria immitis]